MPHAVVTYINERTRDNRCCNHCFLVNRNLTSKTGLEPKVMKYTRVDENLHSNVWKWKIYTVVCSSRLYTYLYLIQMLGICSLGESV